jgi:hypothetical protein
VISVSMSCHSVISISCRGINSNDGDSNLT